MLGTPAGAAAEPGSVSCPDPLVTVTREGSTGDALAVAITSQALVQGVAGWEHLSWQAAPGVQIHTVLVTGTDGEVRAVPAAPAGTVEAVTAVTFCGRYLPAPVEPAPRSEIEPGTGDVGVGDTRAVVVGATAPAVAADTPAVGVGATAPAATAGAAAPAPDDPAALDGPDPARSATPAVDGDEVVELVRATAATAVTTSARGTTTPTEVTEVLGVRLVAPPAEAPTPEREDTAEPSDAAIMATAGLAGSTDPAGRSPWLVAAILAAGLVGAVTLLRGATRSAMTGPSEGGPR
jgi:hypothetical protein